MRMLRHALLGFLNLAPMTGYELESWINASTGNFWHAELSQIYKTLKRLEADALVASTVEPQTGKPDKRVYQITPAGAADLHGWLGAPVLEEVEKKDPVLLKIFFSPPGAEAELLTQLRVQLMLHKQKLEHYRLQSPRAMDQFLAGRPDLTARRRMWEATRRHGELYEEMYVRWIEETIQVFSA
jgi:DNA-binding PadR family transcriptional regulator